MKIFEKYVSYKTLGPKSTKHSHNETIKQNAILKMSNNLNRKSTYGKYACGKLSTLFVTRELQIKAIMRSCTPTRKGKTKQRLRVRNTGEHGVQWE